MTTIATAHFNAMTISNAGIIYAAGLVTVTNGSLNTSTSYDLVKYDGTLWTRHGINSQCYTSCNFVNGRIIQIQLMACDTTTLYLWDITSHLTALIPNSSGGYYVYNITPSGIASITSLICAQNAPLCISDSILYYISVPVQTPVQTPNNQTSLKGTKYAVTSTITGINSQSCLASVLYGGVTTVYITTSANIYIGTYTIVSTVATFVLTHTIAHNLTITSIGGLHNTVDVPSYYFTTASAIYQGYSTSVTIIRNTPNVQILVNPTVRQDITIYAYNTTGAYPVITHNIPRIEYNSAQGTLDGVIDNEYNRLATKQKSIDNAIYGQERVAGLNESYTQRIAQYRNLIILGVVSITLCMGLHYLSQYTPISAGILNMIYIFIVAISLILAIRIFLLIQSRDNMDFNLLKLPPPTIDASRNSLAGTANYTNLTGLSTCIGAACCGPDPDDPDKITYWDSANSMCSETDPTAAPFTTLEQAYSNNEISKRVTLAQTYSNTIKPFEPSTGHSPV